MEEDPLAIYERVKAHIESRVVQKLTFPASLMRLRSLMVCFTNSRGWQSADGERLLFTEKLGSLILGEPSAIHWSIRSFSHEATTRSVGASIVGYKAASPFQPTQLAFYDGFDFNEPSMDLEPIGVAFQEFCRLFAALAQVQHQDLIATESNIVGIASLATSKELFIGWLRDYVYRERPFAFAAGEQIVAETSSYLDVPLGVGGDHLPKKAYISGQYYVRAPDGKRSDPSWHVPVIACVATPRASERIEVVIECRESNLLEYFTESLKAMKRCWPDGVVYVQGQEPIELQASPVEPSITRNTPEEKKRTRSPTDRTEIRARVFRRLKEEHPDWTQDKVALEAIPLLEDPHITGETVRNTYRAMKWRWPRGDKNR